MNPPYTYTIKTAGAGSIEADVYHPAMHDAATHRGPHAVILWLHGGALIMGSRRDLAPEQAELYTRAGYVVVAPDYRLAPETKLSDIAADLLDAYNWVRQEGPALFGADPQRIGVVGHSAGGYLALLAGCKAHPRPSAVVAFYGYGDLVAPWYTRPDAHYSTYHRVSDAEAYSAVGATPPTSGAAARRFPFYLYCRQRGLWPREVGGHDPTRHRDWFLSYCPLYQVTADYPPTLLLHGDQDTDVPYEQSAQMARALARAGVAHELLTLPGYGHGFDGQGRALTDQVVVAAFARALAFLAAALRADSAPASG